MDGKHLKIYAMRVTIYHGIDTNYIEELTEIKP
jgi:hypothetical protein